MNEYDGYTPIRLCAHGSCTNVVGDGDYARGQRKCVPHRPRTASARR